MIKFDMQINEKFASFNEDKMIIFVEQVQKNKFSITAGNIPSFVYIGEINVNDSFELNTELERLFNKT